MQLLRVLITVKTYPVPSKAYDELVCTAGISSEGEFVRLYPINYNDLPYSQQYEKYRWIEVEAEKHRGRDTRKESWRPNCDTLKKLNTSFIGTDRGLWTERSKIVLPLASQSIEELKARQKSDNTSLGIIKPKTVFDLEIAPDAPDWPPRFLAEMKQRKLWETDAQRKRPPRKVPWKFFYKFACDDPRCKGNHRMHIEDWEVGALYWREVSKGKSPEEAAQSVKHKFLDDICSPKRDTYFFVGTVLAHGTWVVIGTFYPKALKQEATLWDFPI